MASALKGHRHYSKEDTDSNWFFLSFHDKDLEALYERYTFPRLKKRMRDANIAQIVCGVLLASAEAIYRFAGNSTFLTLGLRLLAILPAAVMWAVQSRIHKRWVMEVIFVLATSLSGILIAVGNGVGIREGAWDLFGPFRWWSAANEMFFIALLLVSALRFPQVLQIALCQPLFTCFNYLWIPAGTPAYQGMVLAVYIATLIGVLMMCYRREILERREFVSLVNLFADKKRREELLDEMLPRRVRDALTSGAALPATNITPGQNKSAAGAGAGGAAAGTLPAGATPGAAPQTPGAGGRNPRPSQTGSENGQAVTGAVSTSSSITGNDNSAPGSPDGRRQSRLSSDLLQVGGGNQRSARPSATPGFTALPPTAEEGGIVSPVPGAAAPVAATATPAAPEAGGMRAIKFDKRKKAGDRKNEDDDDAPKAMPKRPAPKLLFWDEASQSWIPPNYKFGAVLGSAAVKAEKATQATSIADVAAPVAPPPVAALTATVLGSVTSKKDGAAGSSSISPPASNAKNLSSSSSSRSAPGDADASGGSGGSAMFKRRNSGSDPADSSGGRRGSSLGREKPNFRADEFPGVSAMVAITQRRASQQGLMGASSPALHSQPSQQRMGSRKGSFTDSLLQSTGSLLNLGANANGESGASSAGSGGLLSVASSTQPGMRRTSGFSSFVAERRASLTVTAIQEELQHSNGPVAVPGLLLSPGGSGLPPLGSSRRLINNATTGGGGAGGSLDSMVLPGTPTSSSSSVAGGGTTARALFSSSSDGSSQPAGGSSSLPGNPLSPSSASSPDRQLSPGGVSSPDGDKKKRKRSKGKDGKPKDGEGIIFSPTKSFKKNKSLKSPMSSADLEKERSLRKNPSNVTPLVDPLHDETDLLSFIEEDLTATGPSRGGPASGKDLLQLTKIPTAAVNAAGLAAAGNVAGSPVPGFRGRKGSESDDDIGGPVVKVNVDAIVQSVQTTARRSSANSSASSSVASSEADPSKKKAPPPPPRPSMRFNKTDGIVETVGAGHHQPTLAGMAEEGTSSAFTGVDSAAPPVAQRRVSQAHAPAGRRNSTGARRASLVAAMDMAAAAEAAAAEEKAKQEQEREKEEMPKIPWGLDADDLGLDEEHDIPLPDDGDLSILPDDEVRRPAAKARAIMKEAGLLTPGSKFAPKLGLGVKCRKLTAGSAIMSVSRMKGSLSSMVSRAKPGGGGSSSRGSMSAGGESGRGLHRNSTQGLASVDEEKTVSEEGAGTLRRASSRAGDFEGGGAARRHGEGGDGDGEGGAGGENSESVDTADSDELQEAVAHAFPNVTVMFVYIANLSELSAIAEPTDLIAMLNRIYLHYDEIVERAGVYKVMAIANMYLVVCGAHDDDPRHSETMATAACEIMKFVIRSRHELKLNGMSIDVQIGINNGEVAAGVIGTRAYHWHVFGDTVNVSSRMCSSSEPTKIQISKRTANEIRSNPESAAKFIIQDRGTVTVKGKGSMETAWLCDTELQGLYKLIEAEKAAKAALIAAGLLGPDGAPQEGFRIDGLAGGFLGSPGGGSPFGQFGGGGMGMGMGMASDSRRSIFNPQAEMMAANNRRSSSRKSMLPGGFRMASGGGPDRFPPAPPMMRPMMMPPSSPARRPMLGAPASPIMGMGVVPADAFEGGDPRDPVYIAQLKREREAREEALMTRARALTELNDTAVTGFDINFLTCEFVDHQLEKRFEHRVRRDLLQSTQRALLLATLIAPLTAIPQSDAGFKNVGSTNLAASTFFAIILTAICLGCLLSITLDFPWAWIRACYRARAERKAAQAAWANMMAEREFGAGDGTSLTASARRPRADSGATARRRRGCCHHFWHLIRLQEHDFLAITVAVAFFILMNMAAIPAYGNGEISYLSTVNFTLFVSFSVLEIRAHILLATKLALFLLFAILMLIYVRGTDAAEGLYAQIIIPFLGLMMGHFAAALREIARRKSYLVTHYAHKQKAKCEKLLINMLPSQWHVDRMMRGQDIIETLEDVTLLYSDIKGFTELSSKLSAEALIKFLDALYSAFDQHLDYFGLTKVDTIGDAFIVCGAPSLKDKPREGDGNGSDGQITFGGKEGGSGDDGDAHDDQAGVVGVRHLVRGLSRVGGGVARAAGSLVGAGSDSSPRRRAGSEGSLDSPRYGFDDDGSSSVISSPGGPLSPPGDDDAALGDALARAKGFKSEPARGHLFSSGENSPARGRGGSKDGFRRGNSFISRKRIAGWLSNQQQNSGTAGSSLLRFGKDGRGQAPPMTMAIDEQYDAPSPGRSPPSSSAALTPQGSFNAKKGAMKRMTAPADSFGGLGSSSRVAPEPSSPAGGYFPDSHAGSTGGGGGHSTARHSYASAGGTTASRGEVNLDSGRSDDGRIGSLRTKPSKGILKPQGSTGNMYGPGGESPPNSPRGSVPNSPGGHVPNLRLPGDAVTTPVAPSSRGPPATAQIDVVSQPLAAEERTSLSHCGAVALFAMDMLQEIARIRSESRMPVELRIGLHSGRVVGGIIGKSRPRYFIWGNDTVIANLMESSGIPGQIQVSEPTGARLRKEGFILEAYQTVNTDQGHHGHGDAPAAPANKDKELQTYLLRAYVAPDKTIISVPEPPKKGH